MVLADSKKDDQLGKNILTRSKTHADADGATRLQKDLKDLHQTAKAKKAATPSDLQAITAALDISAAGGKQVKMAQKQAAEIEKILSQSKKDLGGGRLIEEHAKDHAKNQWNDFWSSKHSLVTRLAGESGGVAAAAKNALVLEDKTACTLAQDDAKEILFIHSAAQPPILRQDDARVGAVQTSSTDLLERAMEGANPHLCLQYNEHGLRIDSSESVSGPGADRQG